jgi:hypothetical protein
MSRTAAGILALALLALSPAQAAPPAPQAAAAAPALAPVAFIAGHWVGEDAASLSEEVWTAPAGDSMLGMWRLVAGGRLRISELLSITAGEDGVVLRLRHFDPRAVAREEKDRPLALKLVRAAEGEAVFEGPGVGADTGLVRLTYRRTGPDALLVTLDKGGTGQPFAFTRKR